MIQSDPSHQRRIGVIFTVKFLFSIGIKKHPSSTAILEIIRFGFNEGFPGGVISVVILEIICSQAYQMFIQVEALLLKEE